MFLYTREFGHDGTKKVFSPIEIWIFAAKPSRKHSGSLFSSLKQTIWWWFWVFWNKKEMCENTVKNHKTCFCGLGNWTLLENVTCSTCGSWIIVAPNCQKIHQFILLFITMTALVKFLSFLKKSRLLATSCWEVIWKYRLTCSGEQQVWQWPLT